MKFNIILGFLAVLTSIDAIPWVTREENKENAEPELFEGDIVATFPIKELMQRIQQKTPDNDMTGYDAYNYRKWPNAEVPYTFSAGFAYQQAVRSAIADYEKETCIKFRPKKSSDKSYIRFMHGKGCYSTIGCAGGMQDISLGQGCGTKGTAIHEMMHALGFFHEQSRLDRDNYVTINWDNIPDKVRDNFEKYKTGIASTLNEPYDMKSIMHYGNYAFSTNGKMTIYSKSNPQERLGQRKGLSKIDIRQLNKHYSCIQTTPLPTTTTTAVVKTKRPVSPKTTTTGTTNSPRRTTSTSTTIQPDSVCSDEMEWCNFFVNAGLCDTSSMVRNGCQKSCNNCPTKTKCLDSNVNCPAWARSNSHCSGGCCKNSRYGFSMSKNCRKSCGLC